MPAADEDGGRRLALVVATGTYADATLAGLRAPGRDAADLAAVLADAAVGGFEVETLLDAPADRVRRQVARLCRQGSPRDLLLLYMSCHGVLDDRGRLYYATADTDHELLAATAIPAAWINEQLDDCRCRRQVVVLDCCHSGAFAKGAKGESGLALQERFEGRGRVVLTASRATEYSFEGDDVRGDGVSSVFTGVLVAGLRSGEADRDADGRVTVSELYDYAYDAVRAAGAPQTPMLWTYGAEGSLLVARSSRRAEVVPEPLPDELTTLLESSRPRLRASAVAELGDLLAGGDAGRALTARACLERVAAEDIPRVAALAREALGAAETGAAEAAPPASASPSASPPPSGSVPARARPWPWPARSWRRAAAVALGVLVVAGVILVALWPSHQELAHATIPVPGSPHGISAGGDGVWVALRDAQKVSRVDGERRWDSGDAGAHLAQVVAGQGRVWAVTESGRHLARIDPRSGAVAKSVDVDLLGQACPCPVLDLAIAGGALWAADVAKGEVTAYDVDDGTRGASVPMPAGDFAGTFTLGAPGELWAIVPANETQRTALLVWAALDDPENRIPFGLSKGAVPVDVAYGDGAVWVLDATGTRTRLLREGVVRRASDGHPTLTPTVRTLPAGVHGDHIAVDPGSGVVLVWDAAHGVLQRIDPRSLDATAVRVDGYTARPSAGAAAASDLAARGGFAWITDPAAGTVHRQEY